MVFGRRGGGVEAAKGIGRRRLVSILAMVYSALLWRLWVVLQKERCWDQFAVSVELPMEGMG